MSNKRRLGQFSFLHDLSNLFNEPNAANAFRHHHHISSTLTEVKETETVPKCRKLQCLYACHAFWLHEEGRPS